MIISHKHRYLFIEIPLTASWAIRHELCEYYDGAPILHKHASYPEFRRIATADERSYFVFATVRNPLDEVVSRYFKLKTDHKGAFSNPEATESLKAEYADHQKYKFIKKSDGTFESYFKKYHKRTFGGMIDLSSDDLDFVIRFERLQADFSEVLRLLGIKQLRPVPVMNRTQGRKPDWESYYTLEIIQQAQRVFGPFIKKWGYEFPAGWGDCQITWLSQVEYQMVGLARRLYLTHFRYSDKAYAKAIRWLRAYLID